MDHFLETETGFCGFFRVVRVADLKVVIMVNGNEASDDNYSTRSSPWPSGRGYSVALRGPCECGQASA